MRRSLALPLLACLLAAPAARAGFVVQYGGQVLSAGGILFTDTDVQFDQYTQQTFGLTSATASRTISLGSGGHTLSTTGVAGQTVTGSSLGVSGSVLSQVDLRAPGRPSGRAERRCRRPCSSS